MQLMFQALCAEIPCFALQKELDRNASCKKYLCDNLTFTVKTLSIKKTKLRNKKLCSRYVSADRKLILYPLMAGILHVKED